MASCLPFSSSSNDDDDHHDLYYGNDGDDAAFGSGDLFLTKLNICFLLHPLQSSSLQVEILSVQLSVCLSVITS